MNTELVAFLASTPLFRGLSREMREKLVRISVKKSFAKGKEIFSQGEEARGFYLVLSGRVKVYKLSFQGRRQILNIVGPGEPVGEVAVFQGVSYPAYAQALEDSLLLYFPRRAFVELIKENPSLALGMLAVLSRRLRRLTGLVEELSLKEVPSRLAAYILRLSRKGEREAVLKVTKGQLAEMLGTSPETLSRALARLSSQGLVEVKGSRVRILDIQTLEELAQRGRLEEKEGHGL